jgi:BirA family transcriptional regulator, biotin operon repressor / biotin---[acetyl-CoA-carboxylase] ligase
MKSIKSVLAFGARFASYHYLVKNSNLLANPPVQNDIGSPFIVLQQVESTNNYAMAQVHAGMTIHGMAWFALEQTAGKGQRGREWTTSPGRNIVLSVVLQPLLPKGTNPFALSAAIALACYDLFAFYTGGETKIKWPNDIYWRDRKAAGILIENVWKGAEWTWAIAGIGMNINEESFPEHLPNPVSLKQVTGKDFDAIALAKELCGHLQKRYNALTISGYGHILTEYNTYLYQKGARVRLRSKENIFETTITGVSETGQLITFDGSTRCFDFGEVGFVKEGE